MHASGEMRRWPVLVGWMWRMTVAGKARWTIAFGEGGVDIFAG